MSGQLNQTYRPPRIPSDICLHPSWTYRKPGMMCISAVDQEIVIGSEKELFVYSPKSANSIVVKVVVSSPVTSIMTNLSATQLTVIPSSSSALFSENKSHTIITGHKNGAVCFWKYIPSTSTTVSQLKCVRSAVLNQGSKIINITGDQAFEMIFIATESMDVYLTSVGNTSVRKILSSISVVSMAMTRHSLWIATEVGDLLALGLSNGSSLVRVLDGSQAHVLSVAPDEDDKYEGVLCGCEDGRIVSVDSDGSVSWRVLLLPRIIDRKVRLISLMRTSFDHTQSQIRSAPVPFRSSIQKGANKREVEVGQGYNLMGSIRKGLVASSVGEDLCFFTLQPNDIGIQPLNSSLAANEIDTCIPQYSGKHIGGLLCTPIWFVVLSETSLNIYLKDDVSVFLRNLYFVGGLPNCAGEDNMNVDGNGGRDIPLSKLGMLPQNMNINAIPQLGDMGRAQQSSELNDTDTNGGYLDGGDEMSRGDLSSSKDNSFHTNQDKVYNTGMTDRRPSQLPMRQQEPRLQQQQFQQRQSGDQTQQPNIAQQTPMDRCDVLNFSGITVPNGHTDGMGSIANTLHGCSAAEDNMGMKNEISHNESMGETNTQRSRAHDRAQEDQRQHKPREVSAIDILAENRRIGTRIDELESKILNTSQGREEVLKTKLATYKKLVEDLQAQNRDLSENVNLLEKQSIGLNGRLSGCVSAVNQLGESVESLYLSLSQSPIPTRPSIPSSVLLQDPDPVGTITTYVISRCQEALQLVPIINSTILSQHQIQTQSCGGDKESNPTITTLLEVYDNLKSRHMKLLQELSTLKTQHTLNALWLEEQTKLNHKKQDKGAKSDNETELDSKPETSHPSPSLPDHTDGN